MKISVKAKKHFGQNFLTDRSKIFNIIELIHPEKKDIFVEIGPGLGAITRPLAQSAQKVIGIEIDPELSEKLIKENIPRLEIIQQDILSLDWNSLETGSNQKIRLVGNIPYHLSSDILIMSHRNKKRFQDIHFMVQKEVALRLTSQMGDHDYGRLSLFMQSAFDIEIVLDVPHECFTPAPKVDSSVIQMVPKTEVDEEIERELEFILKQAFMQRRKTIFNNMKSISLEDSLTTLGIDPQKRPQDLSLSDYIKIAYFYKDKKNLSR